MQLHVMVSSHRQAAKTIKNARLHHHHCHLLNSTLLKKPPKNRVLRKLIQGSLCKSRWLFLWPKIWQHSNYSTHSVSMSRTCNTCKHLELSSAMFSTVFQLPKEWNFLLLTNLNVTFDVRECANELHLKLFPGSYLVNILFLQTKKFIHTVT